MKKNLMKLLVLALTLGPIIANAQADGTIAGIVRYIGMIIGYIVPILVTVAVIFFIIGVIKYVISGDEEEKGKARNMIIYGIIGIAVIVALWGFVRLLTVSFGINEGAQFQPPVVPNIPSL